MNFEFVLELSVPDKNGTQGERRSAYWNPRTKTISISEMHAKKTDPNSLGGLFAHEILRAADVDDENYDRSAIINSYSRLRKLGSQHPKLLKQQNSLDALKEAIEKKSHKSRSGGISGVGGGGDIRSQQVKEALLHF